MKYDILIAGVGGQGILLVSEIISNAALSEGLYVKKSETHGMAQRGGSVISHVRISDSEAASPLIPYGKADLLLAFEPLEALRYLKYLGADSQVVINKNPVKLDGCPPLEEILKELGDLGNTKIVDAKEIARRAGHVMTQNIAMLGIASRSLPLNKEAIQKSIKDKVKRALEENLQAFELGLQA